VWDHIKTIELLCGVYFSMIYIVADTNSLHFTYDKSEEKNIYNRFNCSPNMNALIEIARSTNCIDEVTVAIPEIVIDELVRQKYDQYCEDYDKASAPNKRLFGITESRKMDREQFITDSKEQALSYLEKNNIPIIPICGEAYFKDIIDFALDKKPPFEGKNGRSDKGFKDALIYFSIIEYASNHSGEYIFLSSDKIFLEVTKRRFLRNQFLNRAGSQLDIVDKIEDLKSTILVRKTSEKIESLAYKFETYEQTLNIDSLELIPVHIFHKKPVFKGEEPIVKIINRKIQNIYMSDRDYWDADNTKRYDDEQDMMYESSLIAAIKNNEDGLLSIVITDFKYVGGAHGGAAISSYNYDIANGRQLSLTQLLRKDNLSLCKLINMRVNQRISEAEAGTFFEDSVNFCDANNIVYYVHDGEVHLVFNEYELGPYASGVIDIVLCKHEEV